MNKTQSFSLWQSEKTCSQARDLHWNPNIWVFSLDLDTLPPLPKHTKKNYKKIVFLFFGAPRGFGDLGRMTIYFQGASEHW